jgi:RNA polymerase sigma-70 factor (ECF subfamily)
MTSPSDEAIMSAVQDGHPDMLGILFERYHDRVFAQCYGMTGDPTLADDLVQEAFVRVLRYRDTFKARSGFGSWLYRVVRNVCLDHFEARSREETAVQELVTEQHVHMKSAPEDDRVGLLRVALNQLSPEKREVLVLSRLYGFRYAEIAKTCGSNEGTVRVRAHRAFHELKRIVRSMQDEQE